MANRSKLVSLTIRNVGCVGEEGLTVALDNIVCLVGQNNAGKSTVLRAYELAVGSVSFEPTRDRCKKAPDGSPSEIILEVHIPEGIGNIDEKWKDVASRPGLRIVKSRWQWASPDFKKVRTTWIPRSAEGDGAEDKGGRWAEAGEGKSGGADPVFNSRLPRPLRIGSLDDATSEGPLLNLALEPAIRELKAQQGDTTTAVAKTIESLTALVTDQARQHQARFDSIAERITSSFETVFPGLGVRLDVQMATPAVKLEDLLTRGSALKVMDGDLPTTLTQQGTGARRALFWAMLQVHNALARDNEIRDKAKKTLEEKIKKLTKKDPAKRSVEELDDLEQAEAALKALDDGGPIPDGDDDPALPGYILLMDEPENALHPMAARAAQRHLYSLASDPDWQVILTTHSPYFVNPLEDHTTIVRLERERDSNRITPRTYRTDSPKFDPATKKQLQGLQQMDVGFAEMFFGSYPVLVEGDTEHAAFIAAVLETQDALAEKVTVVRARGKALLAPLMRILRHFEIPFGIIHDSDAPYCHDRKGAVRGNGMWTENRTIFEAITDCRAAGIPVRHRISLPDFERFLSGDELGKDKPLTAYIRIASDPGLQSVVRNLFQDLLSGDELCPLLATAVGPETMMAALLSSVQAWAATSGLEHDERFYGKGKDTAAAS